jgi:hypothetical protein
VADIVDELRKKYEKLSAFSASLDSSKSNTASKTSELVPQTPEKTQSSNQEQLSQQSPSVQFQQNKSAPKQSSRLPMSDGEPSASKPFGAKTVTIRDEVSQQESNIVVSEKSDDEFLSKVAQLQQKIHSSQPIESDSYNPLISKVKDTFTRGIFKRSSAVQQQPAMQANTVVYTDELSSVDVSDPKPNIQQQPVRQSSQNQALPSKTAEVTHKQQSKSKSRQTSATSSDENFTEVNQLSSSKSFNGTQMHSQSVKTSQKMSQISEQHLLEKALALDEQKKQLLAQKKQLLIDQKALRVSQQLLVKKQKILDAQTHKLATTTRTLEHEKVALEQLKKGSKIQTKHVQIQQSTLTKKLSALAQEHSTLATQKQSLALLQDSLTKQSLALKDQKRQLDQTARTLAVQSAELSALKKAVAFEQTQVHQKQASLDSYAVSLQSQSKELSQKQAKILQTYQQAQQLLTQAKKKEALAQKTQQTFTSLLT